MSGGTSITPSCYADRLPVEIRIGLISTIEIASVAIAHGWEVGTVIFGTSHSCGDSRHLDVTVAPGMFRKRDDSIVEYSHPIITSFPIVNYPRSACAHFEVSWIYSAPQIATIAAGLGAGIFEQGMLDDVDVRAEESFIESIERFQIHHKRAIIHKIYYLAALAVVGRLADLEGADLRPVRTSPDNNSPQRERPDGAKLWRCTVTKEGAGFRLQYWSIPGKFIELQGVMLEKDVM